MCQNCVYNFLNKKSKLLGKHQAWILSYVNKSLLGVFLALINIYQRYISPNVSARCRYYPTCSAYARQALLWHGVYRGGLMAFKRILRCQPWGGSGVDFVPVPMPRYVYVPSIYCYHFVFVDKLSYRIHLTYLLCD